MEASSMSRKTMQVGVALGVIAVLLVAFTRPIIGNFGTTSLVDGTLLGAAVTILHGSLITASLVFSAALVAASLVMRHTESLMRHGGTDPMTGVRGETAGRPDV